VVLRALAVSLSCYSKEKDLQQIDVSRLRLPLRLAEKTIYAVSQNRGKRSKALCSGHQWGGILAC